jgi:chromosomal replication initiator protein
MIQSVPIRIDVPSRVSPAGPVPRPGRNLRPAVAPAGDQGAGDVWVRVRAALQGQIGKDACRNWIDPLVYLGSDLGVGRFAAPTSFIGTWVSRNYGETIRQLLMQDGQAVSRLEFAVASAPGRAPAAPPRPAAGGRGRAPGRVSRTGRTWSCRSRRSTRASPSTPLWSASPTSSPTPPRAAWPSGGAVSFNPLFLYGGVGLGKTH